MTRTNRIQAHCSALLCIAVLSRQAAAQGSNPAYTKCVLTPPAADACLSSPEAPLGTQTIKVQKDGTGTVVAVIPKRNCRTKRNEIYGGLSLVLDSSDSMTDTDPENQRLLPVQNFLVGDVGISSKRPASITPANNDYPRAGVVSYGGRVASDLVTSNNRFVWEADKINKKIQLESCSDGDNKAAVWNAAEAVARWTEKDAASNSYYSTCEWLRPVTIDTVGSLPVGTTPSLERHADFLNVTGKLPRGSTDLVYFFRSIKEQTMLGNLSTRAKNAIVITDGLPNISKKVLEKDCKARDYLKGENVSEYKNENGTFRVCNYRQAGMATKSLYDYLEKHYVTDEAGAPGFANYNVYNVLFVAKGKAFVDFDEVSAVAPRVTVPAGQTAPDMGMINPADVLIESSARTGNGKVKFKFAKTQQDLQTYLDGLLENFDRTALQRVRVVVRPNGPERTEYNSVSPGGFNKDFSIKLINLRDGVNEVQITAVYSDTETTQTFNVEVGAGAGTDVACARADGNKTVDGDAIDEQNPKGDGVKPYPKNGTQDRVFRNADPENAYRNSDFQQPAPIVPVSAAKIVDPRKLRLQGGTGNCGVVAGSLGAMGSSGTALFGASSAIAADEIGRARRMRTAGLALALAPLAFAIAASIAVRLRRGRKA